MDPEQTQPPASGEPAPQTSQAGPIPNSNSGPNSGPNYSPAQPLMSAEMTERLSTMATDPRVSKYLGKATKVVVACAISGSILLVVAILAVVNLLESIVSKISSP